MPIAKVLVANRGEIARRVFRTCREMGIETVAIFSDPDSSEPHAREADDAIRLPGASPAETYLNGHAILQAAADSGADSIHPGYGFLSENADFAREVEASDLVWIGPPPRAIEIMGSKLASKELMEKAGVPTVPSVPLAGLAAPASAALSLGYPILVKASAGGGGKGMRVVTDPQDLSEAIASAGREARGSFGDDTVFLEKYLDAPRHIEIQVFADTHGSAISLFERECSIQRRHQKIIEESPSTALDDRARRKMGEAAVAAARAVDYIGAGTVEFLVTGGEFYFLEMNTRLQVEHPVTEMVTGLDLVKLQIEIADGRQLPPEALEPALNGHAIEARLYAEDPLNDFLPATGKIHRFHFPDPPGVRIDSGVEDGSVLSVHYDPMLAKVVAHAETRQEATATLTDALRGARIHAPATNRALLVRILESDDFKSGEIDTVFIDARDLSQLAAPLLDGDQEHVAAVATAFADRAHRHASASVQATIPPGWRNSPLAQQASTYRGFHGDHRIVYHATREGVRLANDEEDLEVLSADPHYVTIRAGEQTRYFEIARYSEIRFADTAEGAARFELLPRFPTTEADEATGSLHAPMPGRVVRVDTFTGQTVLEGQTLLVLEAMKMEHALRAPHGGAVSEVFCRPGDQVDAGQVLVVVTGDQSSDEVTP